MNRVEALSGSLMYEFRMQIRRRSVWLVFIALGLFLTQFHQPWYRPLSTPASSAIIYWTGIAQSFLALAFGIMVSDRLRRDRQTKIEELLNTLPGVLGARMFGKYLGSTLATLIPMIAVYGAGVVYILLRWHTLSALPVAIAAFAAIALPGVLFISACSIAFPAIMWVPLYQILFVGYWFWGNLLPGFVIPSLSTTILTPVGSAICTGFFNQNKLEGVCSPGIQGVTALQGIESIALLLGLAIVVMFALSGYLKWQRA
jgi:ABC-2 type transport system permease protein